MKTINNKLNSFFPPSLSVLFLHAHPDDEVFLSGGLISRLSKSNRVYIIYCAGGIVQGEEKTIIRQKEANLANSLLGVKETRYLEFCEPKYTTTGALPLCTANIEEIVISAKNLIQELSNNKSFILISYDKNGGYGNKDHVVVNKIGRILHKEIKEIAEFYEITINRNVVSSWLKDSTRRLSDDQLPKLSYWSEHYGLPESHIDFCYKLSEMELDLKKDALYLHKSQIRQDLFPMNIPEDDFKCIFGYEYFTGHK